MAISGRRFQHYGTMRTNILNRIGRLLYLPFLFFFTSELLGAEITVTDLNNNVVRLSAPAKRVACLIESALTAIYMLEREDTLVAIPTNVYDPGYFYEDLFKYYSILDTRIRERKLPALGNWESVNIEVLVGLKPDLVIIWGEQTRVIKKLKELGIPVYSVFIKTIEDVYKEILDLGTLLGNRSRAEELIDFVKNRISNLNTLTQYHKKKKVYFMWAQHSPFHTAGGKSIVDKLIDIAGGLNICKDIQLEATVVTNEYIIKQQPEVILMWYSKSHNPESILKTPSLAIVPAVSRKQVYQTSDTFMFDMWTLKFLYTTQFFAVCIHPELNGVIDLDQEKNSLLNFFYKLNEKKIKHGSG